MRNKAIDRFLKNRNPAEIKDVEEYNPKTGTSRMISLPGYSIAEQKRMKRDKAKKEKGKGRGRIMEKSSLHNNKYNYTCPKGNTKDYPNMLIYKKQGYAYSKI